MDTALTPVSVTRRGCAVNKWGHEIVVPGALTGDSEEDDGEEHC